jgi:hypothetical protein
VRAASLDEAWLQGSDLSKARFDFATMDRAQLQGANLEQSVLIGTLIRGAYLWRSSGAECFPAYVEEAKLANVLSVNGQVPLAGSAIDNFIEQTALSVPGTAKQKLQERLRQRLITDPSDDRANEEVWRQCESNASGRISTKIDEWRKQRAAMLIEVACGNVGYGQMDVVKAIYLAWFRYSDPAAQVFARGILGLNGKPCPVAKELDKEITDRLTRVLVSSNPSK